MGTGLYYMLTIQSTFRHLVAIQYDGFMIDIPVIGIAPVVFHTGPLRRKERRAVIDRMLEFSQIGDLLRAFEGKTK